MCRSHVHRRRDAPVRVRRERKRQRLGCQRHCVHERLARPLAVHLAARPVHPGGHRRRSVEVREPGRCPERSGELEVMVPVTAPAAGVYKDSDPQACGAVLFSYALPIPAGLVCEAGTAPDCPAGCSSACSGFGCEPCTRRPDGHVRGERRRGLSRRESGRRRLVDGDLDVGQPVRRRRRGVVRPTIYYVAHGTLEATLPGGEDGGTDTVQLSVSF